MKADAPPIEIKDIINNSILEKSMNDSKLEETNISSIDSTKDINVKEVEGLCKKYYKVSLLN